MRFPKTVFAASTLALAGVGATVYDMLEAPKAWEVIPPPSETVAASQHHFAGKVRRTVGVLEESHPNGYYGRHEFVGDGLTVITGGREFRLKSVEQQLTKWLSNGEPVEDKDRMIYSEQRILSILDLQGVRGMASDDVTIRWFAPHGMITFYRQDILRVLSYLRDANHEFIPLTAHNIPYKANAEIFGYDLEQRGTCILEFIEQTPVKNDAIAMH